MSFPQGRLTFLLLDFPLLEKNAFFAARNLHIWKIVRTFAQVMRYRDLDIFDDCTIPAPDVEEVRRQCLRWIQSGAEQYSLIVITLPLRAIANPWLREYAAAQMHRILGDLGEDDWSELRLTDLALEQIEDDIRRITKQARNEQIWEDVEDIHSSLRMRQQVTENKVERLQEQMMQLQQDQCEELSIIRQRIARLEDSLCKVADNAFRWPYYTLSATSDDKYIFEKKLREICSSTRRSRSRDAKAYLALKVEQGIISRPVELIQEHAILQEHFGYLPTYQAYHSA